MSLLSVLLGSGGHPICGCSPNASDSEVSGIANTSLLTKVRIKPLLDLPGVGENLRDHWFAPIQCVVKPGLCTFGENGLHTADIEIITFGSTFIPLPSTEGKNGFVMGVDIQHPFGRGSVHISSSDPLHPPDINPQYFSSKLDFEILTHRYRYAEKLLWSNDMKNTVEATVFPIAPLKSDTEVAGYIKQFMMSGGHLHGSAFIARKDLGGVISSELKVFGTANLRITDASIMPLLISGHFQGTFYDIAEKAAEIIKSSAQAYER